MTPKESLEALDAAVNSWNNGNGVWAKATMKVSWPHIFCLAICLCEKE